MDNINITLNADEFDRYLNLPCSDEFLDCKNERLTKQDIAALFRTTTDAQNGHSNKRPSSDETGSSNEHSGKKFVFRQSNVNSIVRDTNEPPAVQLDLVKHKDSNEKLFNSFGIKKNQNITNNVVRREYTIVAGEATSTSGQRDTSKYSLSIADVCYVENI